MPERRCLQGPLLQVAEPAQSLVLLGAAQNPRHWWRVAGKGVHHLVFAHDPRHLGLDLGALRDQVVELARIRRQMKTSRHVPGEPQPQGALVYPISRTRQAGM